MKKNILVTGGAGFLGSHLCNELINSNFNVTCLDNLFTGKIENLKHLENYKEFKFIKHDVTEYKDIECDYIFHLACPASPIQYQKDPVKTVSTNVEGTLNMLKLANTRKIPILFTSTSEVYGDPEVSPQKESYWGRVNPVGPRSCYDEGKRVGETLSYSYFEHFGVHTNCIRPFNIYGPGMLQTDYRVLPNFALNILNKKPLRVSHPGTQTRTYCYATDAIIGFFLVFLKGRPGEIYNIGNNKPEVTVFDLAKMVKKDINNEIKIKIMKYPKDYPDEEPERRCPDLNKSKKHLGYSPKVKLEDGLIKFFNWSFDNYKI